MQARLKPFVSGSSLSQGRRRDLVYHPSSKAADNGSEPKHHLTKVDWGVELDEDGL